MCLHFLLAFDFLLGCKFSAIETSVSQIEPTNELTGVAVEHVLPQKNTMSPMGFDPGASRIVSHRSTN